MWIISKKGIIFKYLPLFKNAALSRTSPQQSMSGCVVATPQM